MYSEVTPGMCPPHLQQLRGKEISVGTLRHPPMIRLDKDQKKVSGGAIKKIFDIYAKKFEFTLKLTVTKGFDKDDGLIPRVRSFKQLNNQLLI